ncbi:hypothetical protein [Parasphingorhabdus sp.]
MWSYHGGDSAVARSLERPEAADIVAVASANAGNGREQNFAGLME